MPDIQPLTVVLPGGRTATLTPADKGFPDRVRIRVEGGGATTFVEANWFITSTKARQMIAAAANLSTNDLDLLAAHHQQWVASINASDSAAAEKAAEESKTAKPYGLRLRAIDEPAANARAYLTTTEPQQVVGVLKQTGLKDDSVLEWDKDQLERLAILDLDFHRADKQKPSEHDVDELGYALSPSPWLWWRTQGGGLHALYAQNELSIFTAQELATGAMAQLSVHPVVVSCGGTVEIVPRTRHPGAVQKGLKCGPLHETIPDETFACLARFSAAGATQDEIDETLSQNGLTIGSRVEHSYCIIDPGHTSTSPTPVIVMESGMYCHSCAGRLGDGFRSWAQIRREFNQEVTGVTGTEPILEAVYHQVHAHHADYLIASLAPEIPEQCRHPLYSALLKQKHGAAARVKEVFGEFFFVRGIGRWLHADTLRSVAGALKASEVDFLPSVSYIDADGVKHPIAPRVSACLHDGTLPGWTPLHPRLFVPIHNVHNPAIARAGEILCAPKIKDKKKVVSYIDPDKRLSMKEAGDRIEAYFPGISLRYMQALIIAMGCAESGRGMVPMIWATGPSGSAKTTTMSVVQTMFGEQFEDLTPIDEKDLNDKFGECLETTRLILFDDFAKEALDYKRFQTFFLRLNRSGHTFHEMYEGKHTPPVDSAVVMTDLRMPEFFINDTQFGRRVHLIRLEKIPESWDLNLGRFVEGWWLTTKELTDAACAFYSHTVDDFFPPDDQESFGLKMRRLGINLVIDESGHDITEQRSALRDMIHELVMAICNAKDAPANLKKHVGRGGRAVHWGTGTPLGHACSSLLDTLGDVEKNEENLRHVLEPFNTELQSMLGLVCPAAFQFKQHGKDLYIQVAESGKSCRAKDRRVNRELFPQPGDTPGDPSLTNAVIVAPSDVKDAVVDNGGITTEAIAYSFRSDMSVPQAQNGTDFTVYLDFETQSACNLKKYGSYAYAEHSTTKVICAAICVEGYRIFWTMEKYELVMPAGVIYEHGIEFLREMVTSQKITLVCHHMNFERSMWVYCLKLPEPAAWIDTMDLTLMHGLPAGADAAGAYLLGMGKDTEGYKLMMKTCKPDKKGHMPVISQAVVQRYVNYNFRDTDISVGIADRFGIDVKPPWEAEVLTMHHNINHRGMGIDRQFAETLRSFDEVFKLKAAEAAESITAQNSPGDAITRADLTRNKFLLEWFKRHRLELPNMRQDTLEQVLDGADEVELPVELQCVIESRLVVTRAALSKVETALRQLSSDGRIRAQTQAHAAHTGRWGGRGMQPQNLKRPDESFDLKGAITAVEEKDLAKFSELCIDKKSGAMMPPYQLLGSLIRGIIVPAPGHVLLPGDFEQIEARNALWMVEDWVGLKEHIDYDNGFGPDVYVRLAQTIYGDASLTKNDKKKRQAGKIGELACTYGGSSGAVSRFAYSYGIDFAEIGVDPMDIVKAWRAKRVKCVQGWYAMESAFKRAMGAVGKSYEACRCSFKAFNDRVEMLLPSGRSLCYMNARLAPSTRHGWEDSLVITYDQAAKGKTVSHETFGGKLFENCVQAACRDLLAQAMLRVENEGYPIVLHVHDELIPEVPEAEAGEACKVVEQIMCDPPEWAKGMPLRGTPAPCRRYGK